jgi:hypothetical protein
MTASTEVTDPAVQALIAAINAGDRAGGSAGSRPARPDRARPPGG